MIRLASCISSYRCDVQVAVFFRESLAQNVFVVFSIESCNDKIGNLIRPAAVLIFVFTFLAGRRRRRRSLSPLVNPCHCIY